MLSAVIMAISLAKIDAGTVWVQGAALAAVAIIITVAFYGTVPLLVKADDFGLKLTQIGRLSATRSFGCGLVNAMPTVMSVISFVGTAAMLWVGGSIIVHGLHELGVHLPYDAIKYAAAAVSNAIPFAPALVEWIVTAFLDGVIGLALGLLLIPVWNHLLKPAVALVKPSA